MEIVSKLPTDITKIIFQYVSFTPFDKNEFLNYYETKCSYYHKVWNLNSYRYNYGKILHLKKETYNSIIKNKLNYYNDFQNILHYYGDTIFDTIYEYRLLKKDQPCYIMNKRFTQKLNVSENDYFLDDYNDIIKHTKNKIKDILGLTKPLSRLSKKEKHSIYIYYQLHFY